jgi:hypothetical protein
MKRFVLLLLAVSSLLAAHAAIASTRPQYGGTLRVMMHISPNSLDPLDDSQGDSVARNNLTELPTRRVASIRRSPRPGKGIPATSAGSSACATT